MNVFNIINFKLNNETKDNLIRILVTLTVVILFFRYIPNVSFKIIFISQSSLLFLININNINIDRKIIPFFLFVLIYPFFSQELKYFSFIFLIVLLNLLLKKPQINNFKLENIFFYFFCFLIIILAKSVNFDEYFLKEIFINSIGFLLTSTKYSYFSLDPNYATILILMIFNLFFYENSKKYLIKLTIFTFLLIIFTQSKSGIIFYLTLLFFYNIKVKYKYKIIIFFIINLFLFMSSYLFYKNFKSPYEKTYPSINNTTPEIDAYYDEICGNSKFDKIRFLTDCNNSWDTNKKNYVLLKIFGMSTYLKLYSIGFSTNDLIFNIDEYLLPASFKKRLIKLQNSKYYFDNHFSAHNILLKIFQNFGIIYSFIFLINIYIFFKKSFNYNFFPAIFSSMFIGMDIFLFTSILALSFNKEHVNL